MTVRHRKRPAAHPVEHPTPWVAAATQQVTTPWLTTRLLAGAVASPSPTASPRKGLLLLLGAAALAVLALASGSMLRLLRRMDEVRTS